MEDNIIVLNNVTKFHNIPTKTTEFIDWTIQKWWMFMNKGQ